MLAAVQWGTVAVLAAIVAVALLVLWLTTERH